MNRLISNFGKWYLMPLAIVVLGMLSTSLLFGVYRISERQRGDFNFINAVLDLRVTTALFHLWFEQALAAGTRADIEKTLVDLDHARHLSDIILRGGVSQDGIVISPLADPELRKHAQAVMSLLATFREVAFERLRDPKGSAIGSLLDQRFDAIFISIQKETGIIQSVTEGEMRRNQVRSGHLFMGIIAVWSLIVTASAIGLWNREFHRKRAEEALRRAHEELELRVVERTAELTVANQHLQQEIADRQRVEDTLRESESGFRRLSLHFHTLLDAIPDCITLVSPDLQVVWANRETMMIGRATEPSGHYCYNLWHEASAPCDNCPAIESFRSGKAEGAQITRPDGGIWDLRAFPMRNEEGRIENVIVIATDITEKTTMQAETSRAAHLASIGELAAGVAHEINNPINGIINYAQILLSDETLGSEGADIAERIVKEGRRVAVIVKSLLTFARQGKEEIHPVSLGGILAAALSLTESQMKKEGVRLRIDVPPGLPEIHANQRQIQQVFMNIISNARYALNQKFPGDDDGKVLQITCEEYAVNQEPFIRVAFHDQGVGIAPDALERIMNPFFTTKPPGEGTGLGLSISHGIIADHGGKLSVQSIQGNYTTVLVDLPMGERHG